VKYIIEETIVRKAAAKSGPGSTFHKVLNDGAKFSKAGLTPKYIYDNILEMIEVTTDEKIKMN
jgi:hypothetical protein